MGIKPPQEKFRIPDTINGIAAQSGAGGRAECMARQTPVPVTYVDFHAQFPGGQSSAGLSGTIVRGKPRVPELHHRGTRVGGTRKLG
jgi:hypothetical protein